MKIEQAFWEKQKLIIKSSTIWFIKFFIFFILLFITRSNLSGQEPYKNRIATPAEVEQGVIFFQLLPEDTLVYYSTLLNNWESTKELPDFLFNLNFDKPYIKCLFGQNVYSIRKEIFNLVDNIELLTYILETNGLKDTPAEDINHCPYEKNEDLQKSISELALKRLSTLYEKKEPSQ